MKLNVAVPPFNTTMMGMVRGVANAFGVALTDPELYALTGHAFVVNVHPTMCPSGPYCWNRQPFFGLARNVGIDTTPLGFFHAGTPVDDRTAVEARLRAEIDAGRPAGLVNMEFQLITGYDATGFDTSQPWPGHDFPPARLTFGSWAELGEGIHMDFFTFAPCSPAPKSDAAKAALEFALALIETPKSIAGDSTYGLGTDAYRLWAAAVPEHGSSHGCWWSGMVWSECRRMASEWFASQAGTAVGVAHELARDYAKIAANLERVADKSADPSDKVEQLEECLAIEIAAAPKLRQLAASL